MTGSQNMPRQDDLAAIPFLRAPLGLRIAVSFGLLWIVAISAVFTLWLQGSSLLGVKGARTVKLDEVVLALETIADSRAGQIKMSVVARRGDVRVLAAARTIRGVLESTPGKLPPAQVIASRLAANKLLALMNSAYPGRYARLDVVTASGWRILASSDEARVDQGGAPSDDPAVLERLLTPGMVENIAMVGDELNVPRSLMVARQVLEIDRDGQRTGKVLGLVIAYVSASSVMTSFDRAEMRSLDGGGSILLVDSDGRSLAAIQDPARSPDETQRNVKPGAYGKEGNFIETNDAGRSVLATYRYVPIGDFEGWTLTVRRDEVDALADFVKQSQRLFVIALAFSVFGILLVTYVARRISRPIARLANVAEKVSQGDFAARVDIGRHPPGDEVSALAQGFNRMAERLQRWHLDLETEIGQRTRELAEEKFLAQRYLDVAGVMLMVLDPGGRIVKINAMGCELLGSPENELLGEDWFARFVPHARRAAALEYFHRVMAKEAALIESYEATVLTPVRGERVFDFRTRLLLATSGEVQGTLLSALDVSDRKATDRDLRVAAIAFESQEAIMIMAADYRIMRINKAYTRITGLSAEDVVGKLPPPLAAAGSADVNPFSHMVESLRTNGTWEGEFWTTTKAGTKYLQLLTITVVKDAAGVITNYVASFIDITKRKEAADEIENLAFYDPLTKLPNRRLLLDRLQHGLASCARNQRHGALFFIDLDNFKTLNDTRGHDVGDKLLVEVADRLRSLVRQQDTIARLGGDEFVVMLEDLDTEGMAAAQAESVAAKMLDALNRPFVLSASGDGNDEVAHEHHCSSSMGITLFGHEDLSVDELLKQADLAMYQAKAAGRNTLCFFDPQMQSAVNSRAALETDLREAIWREQFVLHYQVQVNAAGSAIGAEVLVRWQHPIRGMVSPAAFIPLAEESGLILPLGHWVLETACRQLAEWAKHPATASLTLAVNISARQFKLPTIVEEILAILDSTGAKPQQLKLELTESMLLKDADETIEKMAALKLHGIGFSLDDFGTGYSSLSYLKRLPLDQLKIDQSFVRDVLTDPNDAAIARTVVALGHSLGLSVIAEGVETEAQRQFLAANHCLAYQGYLFGRPLPIEAFEEYLRVASAA